MSEPAPVTPPWWRSIVQLLLRDERHGPLPALLVLLTIVSGVVDAVSILRLGRVFVANMTGNVLFLGFAVAGVRGFSFGASLIALAGFATGAGFAGRVLQPAARDRAQLLRNGALLQCVLVAVALAVAAVTGTGPSVGRSEAYALAALLALAMGLQNSVALRLEVPDLTTSVLTRTLTGLVTDLGSGRRGSPSVSLRRVLAIATMFAGGAVGAALVLRAGIVAALAVALAIVAVVTVGAALAARRPADWRANRES